VSSNGTSTIRHTSPAGDIQLRRLSARGLPTASAAYGVTFEITGWSRDLERRPIRRDA